MSEQRDGQPPREAGSDAQVNTRRRKLVAVGASSPLLVTIASRPAWASSNVCTRSALASADLSGRHTFEGCSISAGWWEANATEAQWPVRWNTMFNTVFDDVVLKGETAVLFEGKTLKEVIGMRGASHANPANIALHLVGAYLNALTFPPEEHPHRIGYKYTADDVVRMYNSLYGKPSSDFERLKNTLDSANDEYDALTAKPAPAP